MDVRFFHFVKNVPIVFFFLNRDYSKYAESFG